MNDYLLVVYTTLTITNRRFRYFSGAVRNDIFVQVFHIIFIIQLLWWRGIDGSFSAYRCADGTDDVGIDTHLLPRHYKAPAAPTKPRRNGNGAEHVAKSLSRVATIRNTTRRIFSLGQMPIIAAERTVYTLPEDDHWAAAHLGRAHEICLQPTTAWCQPRHTFVVLSCVRYRKGVRLAWKAVADFFFFGGKDPP